MKNKNATVPKNPGNAATFATGIAARLAGIEIFVAAETAHTSIPSATEHVPTKEIIFTPAMLRIQDNPKTNGVIAETAWTFVMVAAIAAGNIKEAVLTAIYTQVNAKLQLQAMPLGDVKYLSAEEIALTPETLVGPLAMERAWEYFARRAMGDEF